MSKHSNYGSPVLNQQALLSTMPKSGTWYLICFLWSYNEALKNNKVNLLEALKTKGADANPTLDALNISTLYTGHWEAPGYKEMKRRDPYYSEWNKLAYYVPTYDFGPAIAEQFNPQKDPDAKVIYIYRNPLDQLISMYRHSTHHVIPRHRQMIRDGEYVDFKNLQEFIFEASGIKSYIKQYHSFKVAQSQYPDNFLLIPYEELILSPEKSLKEILAFLGHFVNTPHEMEAFRLAFNITKIDSMKQIESQLGWTLGQDQTDKNESHIRSGNIGDWRLSLSTDDVKRIDRELKRLGHSITDFIIREKKIKSPDLFLKEIERLEYELKQRDYELARRDYELKQRDYELKQLESSIGELAARKGSKIMYVLKKLLRGSYTLARKSLIYIDSRLKL
ncbi:MAG: sulfotransferase domain-containing protein [Proteobacteria bacterium]|nr:sulfotransferase domain-containing protein [Pseudomonadota bacterium]